MSKSNQSHLILAQGAGADSQSEFMQIMSFKIAEQGIQVHLFDFPYMIKRQEDGKRRPPDRAPKLIESFKQQVENLIEQYGSDIDIYIGGKSMGGRMASLLLAEHPELPIKGGIGLGFPFHAPGKEPKNRLDHFPSIVHPFLFIQGERDTMGNKEEVTGYTLPKQSQLVWLEDGNHDLKPRVKSGFTHEQHLQAAVDAVVAFVLGKQ